MHVFPNFSTNCASGIWFYSGGIWFYVDIQLSSSQDKFDCQVFVYKWNSYKSYTISNRKHSWQMWYPYTIIIIYLNIIMFDLLCMIYCTIFALACWQARLNTSPSQSYFKLTTKRNFPIGYTNSTVQLSKAESVWYHLPFPMLSQTNRRWKMTI
jgi:hypothetical protein